MSKYAIYFFAVILLALGLPVLVAFLINSHNTMALVILAALISVGLGFVLDFVIKKVSKNED